MEDDVKQASADRYAVSQAYRWKAERDKARQELQEVQARLMPEGMTWPMYEDGDPVRIGDVVELETGCIPVEAIEFSRGKVCVKDAEDGDWRTSSYAMHPLKRPAPKVYDADGVEIRVGDTVYGFAGQQYEVTGLCEYEPSIVHAKTVGDGVAADELLALSGQLNSAQLEASKLTHRAPVLAADGRPLRDGETVWDVLGNRRFKVLGFGSDAKLGEFTVKTAGIDGMSLEGYSKPSDLTHERPDSYDALWEDIEECKVGYSEFMRRVKSLAGGA